MKEPRYTNQSKNRRSPWHREDASWDGPGTYTLCGKSFGTPEWSHGQRPTASHTGLQGFTPKFCETCERIAAEMLVTA
jgi:hypothetical protein